MRHPNEYTRIISMKSKTDAVFKQSGSVKDMKKLCVLFSSKKIQWNDTSREKPTIPTSDRTATNTILRKYYSQH